MKSWTCEEHWEGVIMLIYSILNTPLGLIPQCLKQTPDCQLLLIIKVKL